MTLLQFEIRRASGTSPALTTQGPSVLPNGASSFFPLEGAAS